MPRWIPALIAGILGLIFGLIYGLIIDPIQYSDITPEALRIDYRTDYVLMVAEAFHSEQDPALASKRLALLGSIPPAVIVEDAFNYAQNASYAADDLNLLQELAVALQTWEPLPSTNLP